MNDDLARELASIVAADTDLKVHLHLPEDTKVHFLGPPILAQNPATNNLTLPDRFLNHSLIQQRYFFSLPPNLWDEFYSCIDPSAVDREPELVGLEEAAGEICQDHSINIGFWRGRALNYRQLRLPEPLRLSAEECAELNLTPVQMDQVARVYQGRSNWIAQVARGYAGWLLTNPAFLNEHDALFAQWAPMVQRWGLERLGILLPQGGFLLGDDPASDPRWPGYQRAFEQFFGQWRLQGMAAPYLPIPLQPLLSGDLPLSVVPQLARSGGVFCLPDTFPIPSRDELRGLLENALHGSPSPPHLAEWRAMIASNNVAKKSLARYARVFEVQHFYRIFHHRHATALHRKMTILKQVLASFLKTSSKTIHDDLLLVSKRLGTNWLERAPSVPFGPF